jgi:hypothetical protein
MSAPSREATHGEEGLPVGAPGRILRIPDVKNGPHEADRSSPDRKGGYPARIGLQTP